MNWHAFSIVVGLRLLFGVAAVIALEGVLPFWLAFVIPAFAIWPAAIWIARR